MSFILLQDVWYTYPQSERAVIKGISLAIEKGETVALMGPNGSGKTTLGKIIVGIYRPTRGKVLLDGKDIGPLPLGEIGKRIGYVFQNPERQLFSPTVEEEITFGLKFRGLEEGEVKRRVDEMLAYFELEHLRKSCPLNLSRGEKQRLAIAAVMSLDPDFLILDEPTTGLDVLRVRKVMEMLDKIRGKGVGYMIISHDTDLCQRCAERVLYIRNGRLVKDAPS